MPSLMQVGHCSLASLLQSAVSHTRASTAAMLTAATAATGADPGGRREQRQQQPPGKGGGKGGTLGLEVSRLKQGGAPGPACPPPPALSALLRRGWAETERGYGAASGRPHRLSGISISDTFL